MKKKNIIIISVVVLLAVLGCACFGYKKYFKTPDTLLKDYISTLFNESKKLINDSSLADYNILDKDVKLNGNLSFDTDANLDDYEELKDYSLNFDMGLSMSSKLLNLNLNLLKENKDFLSANLLVQNDHLYAKIPNIISKTIDLGSNEFDNIINISNINFTKEDINIVIDGTKEVFINSINKNDVKRETIYKDNEKLNNITYNYTKDNQIMLLNNLLTYMQENDEYLTSLSNITGNEKSELISSIEDKISNYDESDATINLYTKGINNTFKELTIIKNEETTSLKYNDETYTLTTTDVLATLKENVLTLKYTSDENNETYVATITKINDNENKIDLVIPYEDNTYNIHINLKIANEEVKKESITNATTIDSLSITEIQSAYSKFYDIIEGTIFEKLIINSFAGNV